MIVTCDKKKEKQEVWKNIKEENCYRRIRKLKRKEERLRRSRWETKRALQIERSWSEHLYAKEITYLWTRTRTKERERERETKNQGEKAHIKYLLFARKEKRTTIFTFPTLNSVSSLKEFEYKLFIHRRTSTDVL